MDRTGRPAFLAREQLRGGAIDDILIFRPDDVDLTRSPLRRGVAEPTFVLGAFNPGLMRLPTGNLLLMVRVAEALAEPVRDGAVRSIRWTRDGYVLDVWPLDAVDMSDPRQFEIRGRAHRTLALTSLSWLLPVELSPNGRRVIAVHYDRAIEPAADHQQYGIEDARISMIDGRWWMTTCSVGAERHATTLHVSNDGVAWVPHGILLDHQNKDMILFEGRVGDAFMAMTRPLGELWFAEPPGSAFAGGPSINLARSPDGFHWKPVEQPLIRPRAGSTYAMKVGGGTPPLLTDRGWLAIWHGVERHGAVGIYRSFWSLLDEAEPWRITGGDDATPLLEAAPALVASISHQLYLPSPVVFSTGIADGGDHWIVASGEADLACRMSFIPKERFL